MYDYLSDFISFSSSRGDGSSLRESKKLKKLGGSVIFSRLCREYCSRFKWTVGGNSNRILAERIESTMLFSGMAAIAKISDREILSRRRGTDEKESDGDAIDWRLFGVTGAGVKSFDGVPTRVYLTDAAGYGYGYYFPYTRSLPSVGVRDCVLLADSHDFIAPMRIILYYSQLLTTIQKSINAATRNLNGTTIISVPAEAERQIKKQQAAADAGVPYLIKYDIGMPYDISLLTAEGVPEVLRTLYEAYNKTHADFLQEIGIRANNEIDKRTGVNPLEIIQSRQNVDIILNDAFNSRVRAIEYAKDLGVEGLNVTLNNFETQTVEYDAKGNRLVKDIGGDEDETSSDI